MKRELNELYYGNYVHGFENINMLSSVENDSRMQQQQPTDFDPMDDTDIWLNGNFNTDFPLFQDFQCMSSASSTSNSPPTDTAQDFEKKIGNHECLNVMENLGDGDHEFLDPISFFQSEDLKEQQQKVGGNDEQVSIFQGDSELSLMFLEWLKQNRDYISAEDMRSIKLKRSTIESASKRLGSTKEGKKQLLKLILDWVEQHRLQKKQMREAEAINQQNLQNSAPYNFDPNASFYPAYNAPFPDSTPVLAGPIQGYIGDPFANENGSLFNQTMSISANSPMDTCQSWLPSQFTMATASQYNQFTENDSSGSTNNVAATADNVYQLFDGNGGRLSSCATKEARKNRMARQRRLPSNHYRHQTQNQRQITNEQSVMIGGENWAYWSSAAAAPPVVMVPHTDSPQSLRSEKRALQSQNHVKRQACRTEKSLKFLLQKVLKQSDVGSLGRIVLPKKEAENHLPQLESRDGISIAMEDIGTSRVWNMKYRFWPNNKSRMYLLENTGDFVRANELQEGDFIVIYADMKFGKYLIRGVKVRQNGPNPEGKQPAKKNLRKTAAVISSPVAQSVR